MKSLPCTVFDRQKHHIKFCYSSIIAAGVKKFSVPTFFDPSNAEPVFNQRLGENFSMHFW